MCLCPQLGCLKDGVVSENRRADVRCEGTRLIYKELRRNVDVTLFEEKSK